MVENSDVDSSRWTDGERRLSMVVLFMSFVMMSAGRGALPIAIVQMAEEFQWNKQTIVNITSCIYNHAELYVYMCVCV